MKEESKEDKGIILDYPAAARSIALHLAEFNDESLPYSNMIAGSARKAGKEIERLREELKKAQEDNEKLKSASEFLLPYLKSEWELQKVWIKDLIGVSFEDQGCLKEQYVNAVIQYGNLKREEVQELQSEIERLKALFPECFQAGIDYGVDISTTEGTHTIQAADFEEWKKSKGL